MLVLSRRENESIVINDEIEIKIVHIKPDQVKIGIIAPKEVKVYRREIFDAILRENQEAQQPRSIGALKDFLSQKNKKKN